MKKIIIIICLIIIITILLNPIEITQAINLSFNICIKNLFPSLFPFLLLSQLMTNYGFVDVCAKMGKKIMNKVFKVSSNSFYILMMSMLSGSPSNAKYINQLLDRDLISIEEANQLLKFTQFVNPLFIIGTIGITYLNSKEIGILILISHYMGNFIIGFLSRKKINISSKRISHQTQDKSFIKVLTESINDTIRTLLLILGIITSCMIITSVIKVYFNFPLIYTGFLEITQGIKYTSISDLQLLYRIILITFFISFGGLSIHMQVMSILEDKKIRYLPYLINRIIHAIISSIIVTILYKVLL